jgi:hypothetical protein
MEMIGHEAVGNSREPLFGAGTLKLLPDQIHILGRGEVRRAVMCAEREEISIEATVIELAEMMRVMRHVGLSWQWEGHLKVAPTSRCEADGGPHVAMCS